jgi:hypothetical protein
MERGDRTRVVALVGSGLSVPAGYPTTASLTEAVVSGRDVFRNTDGSYTIGVGNDPDSTRAIELIVAFLQRLGMLAADYHSGRSDRAVNYEDLAYLAAQFADTAVDEYNDAALKPSHRWLRPEVETMLASARRDSGLRWFAVDLANEARHYVADIVWHALLHGGSETRELDPLVQLVRDERIDASVFSLNQDVLLERAFECAGVELADGFGEAEDGIQFWRPDGLRREHPCFVKLHGSVDWFLFRDRGEGYGERVGRYSGDAGDTLDPDERRPERVDDRPIILVGAHNEAMSYLNPPFVEAHQEFRRRLNRDGVVALVIGYGWQDQAVNSRIAEWMAANASHRVVVVDPVGEEALRHARGTVAQEIAAWQQHDRVTTIGRPFEQLGVEDYRSAIGLPRNQPTR